MWKFFRLALIGFTLGASIIWVASLHAQGGGTALNVEPGEWQWSERGGSTHQRLCVTDPIDLAVVPLSRIAMRKIGCRVQILDNERTLLTVNYSCNSRNGRNVLRAIDGAMGQLETQGVSHGEPFAVDYDVRRVGSCMAGSIKPANAPRSRNDRRVPRVRGDETALFESTRRLARRDLATPKFR